MSYMEYVEVKIPEEVLARLEELAKKSADVSGEQVTLTEGGFFDWLNKKAKDDGWRMVWSAFRFPFVTLEREVESLVTSPDMSS